MVLPEKVTAALLHLLRLLFSLHSALTWHLFRCRCCASSFLGTKKANEDEVLQVHIVSTAFRDCILMSIRKVPRPCNKIVIFDAYGDCNKLPQTRRLRTTEICIFPPYQRIEVWNQNISRVGSFWRLWSETAPQPSSRFCGPGISGL